MKKVKVQYGGFESEQEVDENLYDAIYQQGKTDKEKQIGEMIGNLPTYNGYIDSVYLWQKWKEIKEQNNETN